MLQAGCEISSQRQRVAAAGCPRRAIPPGIVKRAPGAHGPRAHCENKKSRGFGSLSRLAQVYLRLAKLPNLDSSVSAWQTKRGSERSLALARCYTTVSRHEAVPAHGYPSARSCRVTVPSHLAMATSRAPAGGSLSLWREAAGLQVLVQHLKAIATMSTGGAVWEYEPLLFDFAQGKQADS